MKTVTTFVFLSMLLSFGGWGGLVHASDAASENSQPDTLLHQAVLKGNADRVRQLIHGGSELNQFDAYGSTPLMIAATFGRTEIANALIDAGADLNLKNPQEPPARDFLIHPFHR